MTNRRILVIRTGGLGDGLLMWPALSAMRRRAPGAWIDLLGIRSRLEPLVGPAGADRALEVEGSGLHRLYEPEAEIDEALARSFGRYSTVVVFAAHGDYVLAENLSACGAGEVHAFLPFPPDDQPGHVADHILQALMRVELAGPWTEPAPVLPVSDRERAVARARLEALGLAGQRLALIAPGSGSATKNWPAQGFAELAEALSRLEFKPILVQGPADVEAVKAVADHAGVAWPVLADVEPSTLKGLVAAAALFVGNDAGPTHLAALVGAPVVAIFGPSDPVRWRPLGPRVELVQAGSLPLEMLPVEVVLDACRRRAG